MKRKLILFLCVALMLVGVTGCKSTQTKRNTKEIPKEEYPERTIGGTVAVVEMLDILRVKMIGVPESRYPLPESCKDAEKK